MPFLSYQRNNDKNNNNFDILQKNKEMITLIYFINFNLFWSLISSLHYTFNRNQCIEVIDKFILIILSTNGAFLLLMLFTLLYCFNFFKKYSFFYIFSFYFLTLLCLTISIIYIIHYRNDCKFIQVYMYLLIIMTGFQSIYVIIQILKLLFQLFFHLLYEIFVRSYEFIFNTKVTKKVKVNFAKPIIIWTKNSNFDISNCNISRLEAVEIIQKL